MNEVQLIRHQLDTQRQHAVEVANACAAALGRAGTAAGAAHQALRQACVDYLVCVLAWFEERDQRLADQLRLPHPPGEGPRRAFEEALARHGRSRAALEKLEAACGSSAASSDRWREFAQFFNGVWRTRREAIDALLAANQRVSDWRALSGLDADTILEERTRYERVRAALPPGLAPDGADGGA